MHTQIHVLFAVCDNVLQLAAVYSSRLKCVAVCCSVLQYFAVCCSVLQRGVVSDHVCTHQKSTFIVGLKELHRNV